MAGGLVAIVVVVTAADARLRPERIQTAERTMLLRDNKQTLGRIHEAPEPASSYVRRPGGEE